MKFMHLIGKTWATPPPARRVEPKQWANILMFGDRGWNDARSAGQHARHNAWRVAADRPAVIECGAGTAVPGVRVFGERQGAPLIRIHPVDPPIT